VRVRVEAAARLHLGFLDLGGEGGRRFGSIGIALEEPRCVVEADDGARGDARPAHDPDVRATLAELDGYLAAPGDLHLAVLESIPRHAGLGSGTQLRLAIGLAAARVRARPPDIPALARRLGRGRRSGIGLAVFQHGGFVVDAGRRRSAADEVPPVVMRHPVPDEWRFVLVRPTAAAGLSGAAEERVFDVLPPMGPDAVGRICRLVLMQAAPAVVTDDVAAFGTAVTEIQAVVGEHFAPYQGGLYASPAGAQAVALALRHGAAGVGQSSWGPTVFAIVRGETAAAALGDRLRRELGDAALVTWTAARNRGATWRVVP